MEQLYLLSILSSAAAGILLLIGGSGADAFSVEEQANRLVINEGLRLALGVVSLIAGILKLIFPISGIPVFGDLLPAFGGIMAGFALIYGFYRSHSDIESVEPSSLGLFIERFARVFGFFAVLAAAAHFILPKLPVL